MTDEALVPVFMPPLVTMLTNHEKQKGAPLTEAEVLAIRDKSVVLMMRESIARQMAERRGYNDVNPERCWERVAASERNSVRMKCIGSLREAPWPVSLCFDVIAS